MVGPAELALADESYDSLRIGADPVTRALRSSLYRVRRRFWNGHLKWRNTAFLRALDEAAELDPDWVVANGDYGGDFGGVGLSHQATFDSARVAVDMIRSRFAERSRFVFGDHDLGKYSTVLREGGIRLESLELGESILKIPSFWHEVDEGYHLLGVNSSLFTLDLFLPEALAEEIPEWKRRRAEHIETVTRAFEELPGKGRVILFCHDPSALTALRHIPVVRRRLPQIEMTVIGHLHSPALLRFARYASRLSDLTPAIPSPASLRTASLVRAIGTSSTPSFAHPPSARGITLRAGFCCSVAMRKASWRPCASGCAAATTAATVPRPVAHRVLSFAAPPPVSTGVRPPDLLNL
ncbi:MAG: hypothetical protein M5U15_07725 [Kiritimatiellae bacterium]|nr:hypothetical protein [Kiritimatiellia bacterium]